MYSVKNRVGRLVEAYVRTPMSLDDANRLFIQTRTCVSAVAATGQKVVIVGDLTQVSLFAPEVSDKILQIMRGDTPALERGGYWIGEALPMFTLQFQRLIREAGSTHRRVFTRRAPMEAWVNEILSPDERLRLAEFLDGREKELASASRGTG